MSKNLCDDDRRALDMLLNNDPTVSEAQGFVPVMDDSLQRRIQLLESFLGLLSLMPQPRVPNQLVSRTLDRIRDARAPWMPRSERLDPPSQPNA